MKRKIIKQGNNTLTITLPRKWCNSFGVQGGDEIDIEEKGAALVLNSKTQNNNLNEITVDVSSLLPRLADRFMARAYQKGYDKINLRFDNQDQRIAVQKKVNELIGYEVMKIGKNNIEIESISSQLDIGFDSTLRRGLLLLMDMAETALVAFKAGDKKSLENIKHKDYDVNRFLYFCLRYLNTSEQRMNFGMSILYYLVETLEDLGDELKVLGKFLSQIGKKNSKIIEIMQKMNDMFRLSYDFFYKPKKSNAIDAFLLYKEIGKLIDSAIGSCKNKYEIKALFSIDFSVRIIYHLTTMRLDTLKELSG